MRGDGGLVLVVFWDAEFQYSLKASCNHRLLIDFSVAGYVSSNYQDVMDFVSRVFSIFSGCGAVAKSPTHLLLKNMLEELSRGKKFLAVAPEDTYSDKLAGHILAFFVDRGSPYRHVFAVEQDSWGSGVQRYHILGHGFNSDNAYNIGVNFVPDVDSMLRDLKTIFYVNKLVKGDTGVWDKLARDKEIHYGVLLVPKRPALRALKEVLQDCTWIEFP